jgi:hypothetical protein
LKKTPALMACGGIVKQWLWMAVCGVGMAVCGVGMAVCGVGMAADGAPIAGALSAASYRAALGVGRLKSAALGEDSGLAASRRQANLLWALNDSGNPPVLFALSARGAARGAVRVAGVENIDWEDLAAFR